VCLVHFRRVVVTKKHKDRISRNQTHNQEDHDQGAQQGSGGSSTSPCYERSMGERGPAAGCGRASLLLSYRHGLELVGEKPDLDTFDSGRQASISWDSAADDGASS